MDIAWEKAIAVHSLNWQLKVDQIFSNVFIKAGSWIFGLHGLQVHAFKTFTDYLC